MARDYPLHDHPRSKKDREEKRVAKKGDIDGDWESYGSSGTRKGGDRFKDEDDEGDLDVEGYRKAREEGHDARGTDHPEPKDQKGWRRQFWIKKAVPTS